MLKNCHGLTFYFKHLVSLALALQPTSEALGLVFFVVVFFPQSPEKLSRSHMSNSVFKHLAAQHGLCGKKHCTERLQRL